MDLPPYSYVSGKHPHPLSDPAGHSYGRAEEPLVSDTGVAATERFEEGVVLFDNGYYWESHESWEAVWRVATTSLRRALVQSLIKLAAAAVKGRELRPVGVKKHLARAGELMHDSSGEPAWMGVDWGKLHELTVELQRNYDSLLLDSSEPVVVTMPFCVPRRDLTTPASPRANGKDQ